MTELSLIKNIAYALAHDYDHYGLLRDILADLIPEDEYEELSYEEIYEKYKDKESFDMNKQFIK